MKVCADFLDQVDALNAHKELVDQGVEPKDIEIRSPYPLAEAPIPPHNTRPMIMRNVVRFMWLCGIIFGFSFLTYTQLEWGIVAKTGGQPLVAIPINAIIMYECGMVTAIWVTTFMFFIETRRYRQLVPALEEDLPVAEGYCALVVGGSSADKAKGILDGVQGARKVVTYLIPMLMMFWLTGCQAPSFNMRQQDTIKVTETAGVEMPPHSLRMPTAEEAKVMPPQPFGFLEAGNEALVAEYDARIAQLKNDDSLDPKEARKKSRVIAKERDLYKSELALLKSDQVAAFKELEGLKNPLPATDAVITRGKELFEVNCSSCHGKAADGQGAMADIVAPAPPAIGTKPYATQLNDGQFYYYIMVGKGNMPPFAYKMTTEEIFSVIHFLRASQNGKSIVDSSADAEAKQEAHSEPAEAH